MDLCAFLKMGFSGMPKRDLCGFAKKERRPRTGRRRKERKSMFFLMIGFIKRNVRGFETQCHSECGHAWGDKHGPNAHDGRRMGRTASERPKNASSTTAKNGRMPFADHLAPACAEALTTTAFGSAASGAAAAETALSASSVSTEVPVRLCRAVLSILSAISLPSARATASSCAATAV